MKRKIASLALALYGCLFLGGLSGCSEASSQNPEATQAQNTQQMVASGSWYSRQAWPHDGQPYESADFIIYSDAAGLAAREDLADVAQEVLAELIAEFGIVPGEMFRFPSSQEKIHIYAYKNYYPQGWGMRAYYGGLIAWSLDHDKRSTDLEEYRPVLKHELVHVFELLLKGRDTANMPVNIRVQSWFSEGLAEAVTGGTSGGAIQGRDQLAVLTAKYGERNPIAYTTDGVLEEASASHPMIGFYYYYPMSQLAVEYLLDADGLGRSLPDVRDIFLDMAKGAAFKTAFKDRMGVSIHEYENAFFDLMDGYLPEGDSVLFVRLLIAWAVFSAGSVLPVAYSLARNRNAVQGIRWTWLALTALFGPVGLLCYMVSRRKQNLENSIGWRALVDSLVGVTGKGIGLYGLLAGYHFFAPNAGSGPLILVAPFLVGWFLFRAPLESARSGVGYWAALRRSWAGEILSTLLVLAGMLPVLILLPDRLWFLPADPTSPLFWGLISLSGTAGLLVVYPFTLWMVYRGSAGQTRPAGATFS
jgi:hypothetical protein